jgi:CRISPR-associated endonuclease/helicase Cas3
LLITDLAPTDMLLQRMGRLWRHDRKRPGEWKPEIWIRQLALSDDQLLQASPEELSKGLGKSARVYAPYVLLRSLQQWRGRKDITLPADIRDILEATYAEPGPADPKAWRQLHEELEQQKRRLADQALSNTHIWDQPTLRDAEGVQTRFTSYRMAQLLLARSIEPLNARTVRLQLLEGEIVEAGDRHWNFGAAKAIYRNLTRVPQWSVSAALANAPGWLTNHVSQPTAVGLLRRDGGIAWHGGETETGLSYSSDRGIVIKRKRVARAVAQEESDESYD